MSSHPSSDDRDGVLMALLDLHHAWARVSREQRSPSNRGSHASQHSRQRGCAPTLHAPCRQTCPERARRNCGRTPTSWEPAAALETANRAQRRAAKQHFAQHFRLRKVQRGFRYELPGHGANIVGLASTTVLGCMIQALLHGDYVHDGYQAFLFLSKTGIHDQLHERNE